MRMDHKTVEIPTWQYEVLTKIAFHALKLADDLGWEESWDGKEAARAVDFFA